VAGTKYHLEVGVGLKDGTIFDRKALDFTWSGGAVLGATSAPIQTPPVSSQTTTSTDTVTIVGAALLGAAGVLILFFIITRLRRRGRPDDGAKAA
jgi:hypothetical protein